MAYRTPSLREAVWQYQQTMNGKLSKFLRLLGVDFQGKGRWSESMENVWRRRKPFRDGIEYLAPTVAVERVLFDTHSVLKSEKPEFSYLDDFINSLLQTVPWTLKYKKGNTVTIGKEEKDTVGVSVEQAIEVGGSYGGVEFKSTTTIGSHYDKEKVKSQAESSENDRESSTVLQVPPGAQYRAEQRQSKAVSEITDHIHVVFDIAFKAWCHTKVCSASLVGNSVIDNKRVQRTFHHEKHTDAVLIVKSATDFHEILIGASADFPHQNENLLKKHPELQKHWDDVINKSDRSFEAVDITEFTKTSHGTIHVLDATTNHVVKAIQPEEAPNG